MPILRFRGLSQPGPAERLVSHFPKNDGLRLEHAIARNLCKVTSPINPSDAGLGLARRMNRETRGEVETTAGLLLAAESGEMSAVTQIICRDSSRDTRQRRATMVLSRRKVIQQSHTDQI